MSDYFKKYAIYCDKHKCYEDYPKETVIIIIMIAIMITAIICWLYI